MQIKKLYTRDSCEINHVLGIIKKENNKEFTCPDLQRLMRNFTRGWYNMQFVLFVDYINDLGYCFYNRCPVCGKKITQEYIRGLWVDDVLNKIRKKKVV